MDNQTSLDDKRIGRLLLKLSLPAFFGMVVMTLYNVVDTIFIGHYVGPLGIAGLSIVFPFQMLSIGIGHLTGMGGASLISRLIGGNDIPKAERGLGIAITATIIISAIVMIAGLADVEFWCRLVGSSETILPYARDYMQIILIGLFFQSFALMLNFLIRAEGNARVAMMGMIIGAVLNIILDAIFIVPLEMGVKGAAWATIIAQLVSAIYFFIYYLRGMSFLKIHLRNLMIEWNILGSMLAIGVASFTMMLASSLSAAIANVMLIAHGGDYAVSAFGIINRIVMFALIPGIVIGQGMQPILGFNYGAKRYDLALRSVNLAVISATICSIIAFLVLFFLPDLLMRIFTTDAELIDIGAYASKRIFFLMYVVGFMIVGSTAFQAIGKATKSFITAASRPVIFLIPPLIILPHFWQTDGVWLAFPLSDGLAFILTLIFFIPQIRELRSMHSLTKKAGAAVIPD